MRTDEQSKFTEEQIAYALRQVESGTPPGDVCRQLGVSEATFYIWKKKYPPGRGGEGKYAPHVGYNILVGVLALFAGGRGGTFAGRGAAAPRLFRPD